MTRILEILNEWKALRDAASKGPWFINEEPYEGKYSLIMNGINVVAQAYGADNGTLGQAETNAEFIAASITEHQKLEEALRVAIQDLQSFRNIDHDLKMRNLAGASLNEIEAILEEQK